MDLTPAQEAFLNEVDDQCPECGAKLELIPTRYGVLRRCLSQMCDYEDEVEPQSDYEEQRVKY